MFCEDNYKTTRNCVMIGNIIVKILYIYTARLNLSFWIKKNKYYSHCIDKEIKAQLSESKEVLPPRKPGSSHFEKV